MRKATVTIVVFTALLVFYSLQGNVFARYTLPEYNRTVGYVRNLIDTYNALVENSTYFNRADFGSIKENLSLYHDVAHSFHVVILQSVPDNPNRIALMFFPIRASQLNVTMDDEDTFNSLFPIFYVAGEYILLENSLLEYGNTRIQLPLVFVIPSTDISGDYVTNSKTVGTVHLSTRCGANTRSRNNQPHT